MSTNCTPEFDSDPHGKPLQGSSSLGALPAIAETRPSPATLPPEWDGEEDAGADADLKSCRETSAGSPSGCRNKKGVKDRIRGLREKYVSCLQAIDGAGDVRACAGGPAIAVPAGEPVQSAPSLTTGTIAK